ncbi:hypothetical protein HGRIS_002177 [Hohenbuehelia grisea]|uniref:DUF300-domain-containing protein n=1 Tax=Hohenbuehelia grisea TaxID=104357 RepID=A0ABR3JKE6_9AGAR
MTNSTCHKERAENGPSLFQNGNLVFQAHHVGWIVASFFTIVAIIASWWLVNKHLQWYTNKREQRYIVRLLFMVPIYAVISLASYLFWNHSTPLILIRDAYESTVLTSFFYLLLVYVSPDPDEQKAVFLKVGLSRAADREAVATGEKPKKWVFPLGFMKWKPADGLYFLQLQKWGVLQYCVLRPLTTLAAVVMDDAGLYCESSWGLGWGHVYIVIIVSISVTIAMYCLIQLYVPVADRLKPQKPLLKLFAVKAVVFLTFWQATGLSVLTMFGVVKDTKYMTAEDINIGIGALLETFEMMLFAFLHIKAFTYKPYRPFHDPKSKDPPPQRTKRLRALGNVLDFRETFRELRVGWLYIWDRLRGREPRHDYGIRRIAHLEGAIGRGRPFTKPGERAPPTKVEKEAMIEVQVDEMVEVDGERQWLGVGDSSLLSLGRDRREKSETLEAKIHKELERRRRESEDARLEGIQEVPRGKHPRSRSWWRSIYDRVSHSGDVDDYASVPPVKNDQRISRSRAKSRSRHASRDRDSLLPHDYTFDDPPPPSLIRSYRDRRRSQSGGREDIHEASRRQSAFAMEGLPIVVEAPPPHDDYDGPRQSFAQHESTRIPPNISQPSFPVTSDQYLTPPSQFVRSDSLLGRVFPKSTDHLSSIENSPPTDSAQSMLSVSRDGCSPSQATPRARLVPTSPIVVGDGRGMGMAGERSTFHALVTPPGNMSGAFPIYPHSAEVVLPVPEEYRAPNSPEWYPPQPESGSRIHRRESAFHTAFVESPPSSPFHLAQGLPVGSPSQPWELHSPPLPPMPQQADIHLRRNSARLYSPHRSTPRRPRELTVPAPLASRQPPPQYPGSSRPRAERRTSAPMDEQPSSNRHRSRRPRHSADNSPSLAPHERPSASPQHAEQRRRSSQPYARQGESEPYRSPRVFIADPRRDLYKYPPNVQPDSDIPPS